MHRMGHRGLRRGLTRVALVVLTAGALGAAALPAGAQDASPGTPSQASIDAAEQAVQFELAGDADPTSLHSYWTETFPTFSDVPYRDPDGGIHPYRTGESPGGACAIPADQAAMNGFYCWGDESIVYDVNLLGSDYDKLGPVGPMTFFAHEWGHHLQQLMDLPGMEIPKRRELQATCFAGMYFGFLRDHGILTDDDIAAKLASYADVGLDEIGQDWTAEGVHGLPNELRQAMGIGYATGSGAYCLAYQDWQDQAPAALFGDKSLRLEPFADPTPQEDGSLQIELPDASVLVWGDRFDPSTSAMSQIGDALAATIPEAIDWTLGTPADGWLEALGWGTGSGSWLPFAGMDTNGNPIGGAAALQIDPSGNGELWVAWGAASDDAELASAQGQAAIDALSWGYCDPEAEVTANCPAAAPPSAPSAAP